MRQCGVCKRPPREGELMSPMRLQAGDVAGCEPGLYQACRECVQQALPKIADRVNSEIGADFTPETLPHNFLV